MNPFSASNWRKLVRPTAVTAGVVLLQMTCGAAYASSQPIVSAGPLVDYATTTRGPLDGASAWVTIVPGSQESVVTLRVAGIDRAARGTRFGAHLHAGPCVVDNPTAALGHYNTDVEAGISPPRVDQTTEVWLDFTATGTGRGRSETWVPFVPKAGSRSVVIHAEKTRLNGTAGPRLACLPVVWAE